LYNEAMEVLRPTSLESWDQMFYSGDDDMSESEVSKEQLDANNLESCVRIANLALETGTLILIPSTLSFGLSEMPLSKIAQGSSIGSDTYFLRHEGLVMACSGYERLRKEAYQCFQPRCRPGSSCDAAVKNFVTALVQWDSVALLEPEAYNETMMEELCTPCRRGAEKHWAERRKKVWDELPSYFCLPPWEELLASS
jgi:hypothetical protein